MEVLMRNHFELKITKALAGRVGTVVAVLLVSACATGGPAPNDILGFREHRSKALEAMRNYRNCNDDAMEMDTKARKSGDAGRYIASARLLEKCESQLSLEASEVGRDERVRSYALSIQNYLKGGDVESARSNLDKFKKAFSGIDLYYQDGSSFIETMEVLLGQKDVRDYGQLAALNVNALLKDEIRRIRYWKRN
jgi:hypothetical protein